MPRGGDGGVTNLRDMLRTVSFIVENSGSPFARSAFPTTVENDSFFKRSDEFVSVSRHGNRNRHALTIIEMSICNIYKLLKVKEKLSIRPLGKRPKSFPSFDMCVKIYVCNSFAAGGFDVLPEGNQALINLLKILTYIVWPRNLFQNIITRKIWVLSGFCGISDFSELKNLVFNQNIIQISKK
jgi:hypothetical protein